MNIEQVILMLHIGGAVSVGLLVIFSFVSLIKRLVIFYKPLALCVAFGACFQMLTGLLLAVNDQNSESIVSFCTKLGIYLFFVLLVEALLFRQLMSTRLFPIRSVVSSLALGLIFIFITIFHYEI